MLNKTIDVEVVKDSFPNSSPPKYLVCPPQVSVDLGQALFMLGQLTSPAGFSAASPTRYWAWIRYFAAISIAGDLRITEPFADLDPHQKTILSDDLGVAITTRWLFDRLNGFAEIVDGRRFMLQYASLTRRPKRKTPKVGISKCPDYVVLDHSNRWHVLECKGTQSTLDYRNRQLNTAYLQKQVVDVRGSAKGERLAAGIFLGNDLKSTRSHLRVIDPPEVDPYVVIGGEDRDAAAHAARRLAASRALGLAGFDRLSRELALPEQVDGLEGLYTRKERAWLTQPANERWKLARQAFTEFPRREFTIGNRRFIGSTARIDIPNEEFRINTGCTSIEVSQGVSQEFVDSLSSIPTYSADTIENVTTLLRAGTGIELTTEQYSTSLFDGDMYAARMQFLK